MSVKFDEVLLLGGISVAAAIWGTVWAVRHYRSSKRWKRVGKVDELWLYPLKSGKGKSVTAAEFQRLGMKAGIFRDRSFCIVDDKELKFVSIVEHPQMSQIDIVFRQGSLWLTFPGMTPLAISQEDLEPQPEKEVSIRMLDVIVKTIFVSTECDKFISQCLKGADSGYRLVYHSATTPQRPVRPKHRQLYGDTLKKTDVPLLNYTTSYTLLTLSSLRSLNEKLASPVTPLWFRSNIVISTDDGSKPFQEDDWTGKVRIGQAVLRWNKPCNRCTDITIDPETGIKDPNAEPLRTLRQFRLIDPTKSEAEALRRKVLGQSPLFAVNYSLETAGVAGVGDDVFVEIQ